ncbi:hypothetical protein MIMGU_mgv1a016609mg [Erythranthe guttata]|uniref:Uncharacterized protein n=3 Tax=Erythranthe guttata TaxID=4155 RepID=A0A022QUX5_ERYGU|nr:hypothetical protein MIMGU_mgv1a016609mg [Erythranthe guttata]
MAKLSERKRSRFHSGEDENDVPAENTTRIDELTKICSLLDTSDFDTKAGMLKIEEILKRLEERRPNVSTVGSQSCVVSDDDEDEDGENNSKNGGKKKKQHPKKGKGKGKGGKRK